MDNRNKDDSECEIIDQFIPQDNSFITTADNVLYDMNKLLIMYLKY